MSEILDYLANLLSTEGFPARWVCGNWTDFHGWFYVLSDIAIWAAYYTIPFILLLFIWRRRDLPFPRIFWLFAAFIFACGTTHLMDALMFWWPAYRLSGLVFFWTAVVSWVTVFALIPVVPKVMALKTPAELERLVNERTEALRQSEERFRAFTDNGLVGLIFWRTDGTIIDANDKFLNMLGYSMEDLRQGQLSWVDITPSEYHDIDQYWLGKAMNHEYVPPYEKQYQHKDGHRIDILIGYSLFEGSDTDGLAYVLDISLNKRAEQALRETESRFRNLADMAPMLINVMDETGRAIYVNKAWVAFTGHALEGHLGDHWMDHIHPQEQDAFQQEYFQAFQDKRLFKGEYRLRNHQGEYRWMLVTGAPRFTPDGSFIGYFATFSDVNELKRTQQVLQERETEVQSLNEELEQRVMQRTAQLAQVNHELESFSYSVSHDLRAPLRTIDGFSQAVLELYGPQLDDRGQDYLNRIRNGSQQMASLIDDILNLSRLTRSRLNLESEINLSEIAAATCQELQVQEPERNVTCKIQPDLVVEGDRRLLEVVLQNLLGNAWKFTAKQSEAVVEFGSREINGETVYFVRDNGAGFDMAYADKLFEPFQRLHHQRDYAGTGIGLASVKRIIHRHGGKIWAEAAVNQGATFYFTLVPALVDPESQLTLTTA